MIYAVVNENDQYVRPASYDPPLSAEEIDKGRLPNGKPSLRPLVLVDQSINEDCERFGKFIYEVFDDHVTKRREVLEIGDDEKRERRFNRSLETRRAALPPREQTSEILATAAARIIEHLDKLENRNDPRTTLSVGLRQSHAELKKLVALCAANPIEKS